MGRKDGEVRLGDDTELHPGDLTEHGGEIVVKSDEDEDTVPILNFNREIELERASGANAGERVSPVDFGDEDIALGGETERLDLLAESFLVPCELTVEHTDVEVKVDRDSLPSVVGKQGFANEDRTFETEGTTGLQGHRTSVAVEGSYDDNLQGTLRTYLT